MNMKISALVLSAALFSIFAIVPGALFGQDIASGRQPIVVDLAQAADSPLRLTRAPSINSATFGVRIENVGQAPIVSYVIVARGVSGKTGESLTYVLNDWLLPGSSSYQSIPVDQSDNAAAYTVDYVRFAGGSSWGADSARKSATVDAIVAGRQAAIERLRELVSLQDYEALLRLLNSDPAGIDVVVDASRSEQWQRHYRSGYRAVISSLAQYRDQGQDAILAKLASMQ